MRPRTLTGRPLPGLTLALTALATALLAATGAGAAEPPRLQFVAGDVSVLRADGTRVAAQKGDLLEPGDRLITGARGMAQVRAADQGVVALRPASEIEFKPQALGLGVVLNQGQVRAVTDLGGPTSGRLQVITPDSNIAVSRGDVETGFIPAPEGSSTFSQVRTGEVTLNPDSPGATPLANGQSFKTMGDLPVAVDAFPVAMKDPVVQPPVGDLSETKVAAALPAQPILDTAPALPTETKLPIAVAALGAPGISPVRGQPLNNQQLAVPQVRVEASSTTIAGASAEVNQALSNTLILNAGMVGKDVTLTSTSDTRLSPKRPPVEFKPSTVVVNGQSITGIAPPSNSAFISEGAQVKQLLLVAPTVVTPTLNTPSPVISVSPIKTQLLNTSTLNLNTVVPPTSTNITGGFRFGGIRR